MEGCSPKFGGPLAGTILPYELSDGGLKGREWDTYIGAALKDDWLMTRPFTICKCTYSSSRFVCESGQHIIESLVAKCFHKPLTIIKVNSTFTPLQE